MAKHFYLVALRRCRCGKPAEYEVQGSGNETYDYCCKRCAERRKRELIDAWADKKEAPRG